MLMFRAALLTLALANAALAAEPMTAEEFDAYTRGKTLFFGESGKPYGAEIYHENRRVTWSFLDGVCKKGVWYPEGDAICFVYEDNFDPQCWIFREGPGGLLAEFQGEGSETELYEAQDLDEEMICLGPNVGV